MPLLLLLAACSDGPTLDDDRADDPAVPDTDTAADTDSGTADTDSGDTDTGEPGESLELGASCEPDVSDCGPDALCCVACCRDDVEPVCTLADEYGGCPLPDLWVDESRLTRSLEVQWIDVAPDSCEIEEGCVDASGRRRVMRFDTTTPNTGTANLVMGRPENNPENFQYSQCHDHYHFSGYADYRLLGADGSEAATGHKQAFCLMDFENWDNGGRARYDCSFQGISMGWADTYDSYLPCQWIDITDVQPGSYTLEISLNADHYIRELSYDNNILQVGVTVEEEPVDTDSSPD